MEINTQIRKAAILLGIVLFVSELAFAGKRINSDTVYYDSTPYPDRFIHKFGVEAQPGYIVPTNSFLKGDNYTWEPIRHSFSAHVKYAFQFHPNTCRDRIYGGAYQGIGLAYFNFGEKEQLGNPTSVYLFQGARIAKFNPRLSLNYEWNLGFSFGWEPYDAYDNPDNVVIGSRINAYINTNFYLNWAISPYFDLTSGVSLTHFSNGNTKFPNAGLNTVGLKVGVIYNFNRKSDELARPIYRPAIPEFPRHMSYDLTLFGSWRRKGVISGDEHVPSPDTYTVLGFSFAPMYNIGYKLRVGASLDGVYDGSANIYPTDQLRPLDGSGGSEKEFSKPPLDWQIALGVSGRAEFVMPYFTVGVGIGVNALHRGGDLKVLYQILALKTQISRNSFLHIGYNLQDFHTPSYLMLGIGYRFNNKYPRFKR